MYNNTDLQQNKRTRLFYARWAGRGGVQLAVVQGQSILSSFAGP